MNSSYSSHINLRVLLSECGHTSFYLKLRVTDDINNPNQTNTLEICIYFFLVAQEVLTSHLYIVFSNESF